MEKLTACSFSFLTEFCDSPWAFKPFQLKILLKRSWWINDKSRDDDESKDDESKESSDNESSDWNESRDDELKNDESNNNKLMKKLKHFFFSLGILVNIIYCLQYQSEDVEYSTI